VSAGQVTPGEEVTITARVENFGAEGGLFTAIWYVDGQPASRQSYAVDGDETIILTLNRTFSAVGTHIINLSGRASVTVDVVSQRTERATTTAPERGTTTVQSTPEATAVSPEPDTRTTETPNPETDTPIAPTDRPGAGTTATSGPGFGIALAVVAVTLALLVRRWR